MKKCRVMLWIGVLLVTLCWTGTILAAGASENCKHWVGKVVSLQGTVEVRKAGENTWIPVGLNHVLCHGDMMRTQKRSRTSILLSNESSLRLDQMTILTINQEEKKDSFLVDLIKGAVHFFSRAYRGLKVATPFVNGSVEGTEFYVRVESDHTFISIFEGQISAVNDSGTLVLSRGQSAQARKGQAPALRMVASPRDAVQWALYYPPVLDYRPRDFQEDLGTGWQAMVRRSLDFYRKGDLTGAFASLDPVDETLNDPRFFIYRASLLLNVGRLDEAKKDIQKAADLDPMNSQVSSFDAIIAIVKNKKDRALDLAQRAVELDVKSATARVALSYVLQSRFDLRGALANLKVAITLDPENALARARLAELFLSFGDHVQAVATAQKAVTLNPFLARPMIVLGFAYIAQTRTRKAVQAFTKAIELEPSDPIPRLGLGLAFIREGNLKQGRSEIEVAASLDPGNSLIRSYLGKAYFEEKREAKTREQFIQAKALDPDDPTPWFYDAIFKQTVNRPVEALHDIQKSIELNDNRAVYRSRLLLDEDLAARSASLSRIYSDLRFDQLALVEGYKSLNTDPSNYSAHGFLSDAYSVLPRHEIARISERLQSQLLQPINIHPVRPELAEGSLSVMAGAGPTNSSFNEFSRMFNRDGLSFQASGVAAGNKTWGEELVTSGIWKKLSFSLGQYHYETEGFRENNDQDQNIYNAFAQVSISPQTSIQTEYRNIEKENGDLPLHFYPDFYFLTSREREQTESIRLGYHHSFGPHSRFISSLIYQNKEFKLDYPDFGVELLDEEDGFIAEGQHLFRSKRFFLINGLGYFNADRKSIEQMGPVPPYIIEKDIYHTNFYSYAYLHSPKNLTWILGGSGDLLEGAIVDKNPFNPKFGILWNPYPATTLRASIFRTLQRTLLSSQTLEPTQVAGFNQFFHDAEGTESLRYGVAVDQKFSKNLYGGLELSRRNMEVPFEYSPPPDYTLEIHEADWKTKLLRTYLYWAPKNWMALSADYQYETFEKNSDPVGGGSFTRLETHRLPLGVSFFHPAGFIARMKTTYVFQNGQFTDLFSNIVPGDDHFWVVDAGIGYRLPRRTGMVTLEAKNFFDKKFTFEDTDPANPDYFPERTIIMKFTLSF